jgi:hypothetical protein
VIEVTKADRGRARPRVMAQAASGKTSPFSRAEPWVTLGQLAQEREQRLDPHRDADGIRSPLNTSSHSVPGRSSSCWAKHRAARTWPSSHTTAVGARAVRLQGPQTRSTFEYRLT